MRVPAHYEAHGLARGETAPDMEHTHRIVRDELGALVAYGDILGAFAFGSTQFGDHSALSDYDLAVVIEDAGVDAEMASLHGLHMAAKRIYAQTGVPLEVSCYTDAQLRKGFHGFPDTFLAWLKEQRAQYPENVMGVDFIGSIQKKRETESPGDLADIDDYVARTRHVLRKNWLQGCYYRPHDLLSITLNIPHILGRKSVDTLEHSGAVARGTLKDLSKQSISEAVAEVFGEDKRLLTLYNELSRDMYRFTDELIPEVTQLSAGEYDQIVEATLEENLPKATELLRRMQEAYRAHFNRRRGLERARTRPYSEKGTNDTYEGWLYRLTQEVRATQYDSF